MKQQILDTKLISGNYSLPLIPPCKSPDLLPRGSLPLIYSSLPRQYSRRTVPGRVDSQPISAVSLAVLHFKRYHRHSINRARRSTFLFFSVLDSDRRDRRRKDRCTPSHCGQRSGATLPRYPISLSAPGRSLSDPPRPCDRCPIALPKTVQYCLRSLRLYGVHPICCLCPDIR